MGLNIGILWISPYVYPRLKSMTFLFLNFDHISMRCISKFFCFRIIFLFTTMSLVVEWVRLACTQLTINRFSKSMQQTEIATVVRLLGIKIQGQALSFIWLCVSSSQSQNFMPRTAVSDLYHLYKKWDEYFCDSFWTKLSIERYKHIYRIPSRK